MPRKKFCWKFYNNYYKQKINLNKNEFLIRRIIIRGKSTAHLLVLEERSDVPGNGPLRQVQKKQLRPGSFQQ